MAQALTTRIALTFSLISNATLRSNRLANSHSFTNFSLPKIDGLGMKYARVGGVAIPNNKRVQYSLQYIHGIGRARAKQILSALNMVNKHTKELSEFELIALRDEVSKYLIGGDLKRFNELAVGRLKDIQCYRGVRHFQGLPCRGQRTKTNSRTLKGKGVAIAGKKKAPG